MIGKKFDAHEKHFKEKEIKYNREIKHLHERTTEINTRNLQLEKENEQLNKENLNVNAKYEKLLEYSKLTDIEVKEALKMDKSAIEFSSMLKVMTSFI